MRTLPIVPLSVRASRSSKRGATLGLGALGRVLLFAWAACGLLACGDDDDDDGRCTLASDCSGAAVCVDGRCVTRVEDAGTDASADAEPSCTCEAGEVCRGRSCVSECGNPASAPCAAEDVCDLATGRCVAEGTSGILTGDGVVCGVDGPRCLPGTECAFDGSCVPAPPCFSVGCDPERTTCWGTSCVTARPAGACELADLERLNQDDFLRGGDGGAFDFEIDDACNAYVVTMISGPDYLRQVAPDGTITIWEGVTNLNMGEVAALRLPGDEFGTEDGEGEVALTYVCCAACGCVGDDPQGVARLDREGAASLPMVVIAMPSPGDGPFGVPAVDTGPYGLTWGRDRRLYVGNVTAQGDLVEADLEAGTTREIHRLDARIHATTPFGATTLLVALAGGRIVEVDTRSDATRLFADVEEDVTSLVRDPFTGRVYVSVRSARVLELGSDGASLGVFAEPGAAGRLAYAPDGRLYHLVVGWPTRAALTRYDLPATLP